MLFRSLLSSNLLLRSSLATCIVALLLTGCAYRPDLPQGNFTEQKDVSLLRVGMTQEQVKYVLGPPMLTDLLDKSKWYYVNFKRVGWDDPEFKTLVVTFDSQNRVKDIKGDFNKNASFDVPL